MVTRPRTFTEHQTQGRLEPHQSKTISAILLCKNILPTERSSELMTHASCAPVRYHSDSQRDGSLTGRKPACIVTLLNDKCSSCLYGSCMCFCCICSVSLLLLLRSLVALTTLSMLAQNAMRATVEFHIDSKTVPEVKVQICKGEEDLCIKVRRDVCLSSGYCHHSAIDDCYSLLPHSPCWNTDRSPHSLLEYRQIRSLLAGTQTDFITPCWNTD